MAKTLESKIPDIVKEMNLTVPRALELGAKLVADGARERVPVDTGRLRDAIHTKKVGSGGVYSDQAVVAGNEKVFYGHLVEHGGAHRGARPFLIPAMEANRPRVMAMIEQALKNL